MSLTKREQYLLNLYRSSELHGALLMGRIARSVSNPDVLVGATRHCATEATHAALLTELIANLGGAIEPATDTIQEHYSVEGGIPKNLVDLLVLSEVLEARVLISYRDHLQQPGVDSKVRATLEIIVKDEEAHSGQPGWVERCLATMPPEQVSAAYQKWRDVDAKVAADLQRRLARDFEPEGATR
jgi:hypothetical protein